MGALLLSGLRVLVVEDQPIIALNIAEAIIRAGGSVVGPAYGVSRALSLISSTKIDVAVLDYRLETETALPIAEVLLAAGMPFLFHTSSPDVAKQAYPRAPILDKPAQLDLLVREIRALASRRDPSPMSNHPPKRDPEHPVVEPRAVGDTNSGQSALKLRIRQQELLAELGVIALKRTTFGDLLDTSVRLAAEGLEAEFCKILEYQPAENRLLMVAGVGWAPGLVGVASIGVDLESPSGFALRTGKPVISNHLENEERFRTPDLLRTHGVRRAINVILQGNGAPYGVLEVDSRSPGEFSEHDITFLQGAANILGMAIERQRYERDLRSALDHQRVLIDEINHRVKNSLQLVASLFSLQANASDDPKLSQSLQAAVGRIAAVARVHERLYRSPDVATVDLTAYVGDICNDLGQLAPHCEIAYQAERAIPMATDRAVRVALLMTELVTNAAKHGGPGRTVVRLEMARATRSVILAVHDEGPGLPADFNLAGAETLGMKIIAALVDQMGATITASSAQPGAEFRADIPIDPP